MGPFLTGVEGEATIFAMISSNGDSNLKKSDSGLRRGLLS